MTFRIPLMPQLVRCPKCQKTWFRRTFNSEITTCSKCKATVTPIVVDNPKNEDSKPLRLIRCGYCGGLQWYTGVRTRTTCMNPECAKKNIIVDVVSPKELRNAMDKALDTDEITGEEGYFYNKTIEKYEEMMRTTTTA